MLNIPDSFTLKATAGGIMVALRTSSEPSISVTILACNTFPWVLTKSSLIDDTLILLIPPIRTTIVFLISKYKELIKEYFNNGFASALLRSYYFQLKRVSGKFNLMHNILLKKELTYAGSNQNLLYLFQVNSKNTRAMCETKTYFNKAKETLLWRFHC